MNDWNAYYKQVKNNPRPLLVEALPYAKKGNALDLGAGSGGDSKLLEKQGYSVVSIDSSSGVKHYLPDAIISKIEDFVFPVGEFQIVNAQYALPFVSPSKIDEVMKSVVASIAPRGIFVGQFFGPEDSWSVNKEMNFQSEDWIRSVFSGFELIKLEEEKKFKNTAAGEPHFWHVFHVIAKRA